MANITPVQFMHCYKPTHQANTRGNKTQGKIHGSVLMLQYEEEKNDSTTSFKTHQQPEKSAEA
jgi:hypothetical protein